MMCRINHNRAYRSVTHVVPVIVVSANFFSNSQRSSRQHAERYRKHVLPSLILRNRLTTPNAVSVSYFLSGMCRATREFSASIDSCRSLVTYMGMLVVSDKKSLSFISSNSTLIPFGIELRCVKCGDEDKEVCVNERCSLSGERDCCVSVIAETDAEGSSSNSLWAETSDGDLV
eukprot:Tbor_TRINITY_DN2839_c0_g1::TRINITY_DN2839_c0_g1_i1::g.23123::m.23123